MIITISTTSSLLQLLHGKPKLEAIEGNLKSAANLGLEDLESAQTMKEVLSKANAWRERAVNFFESEDKQPLSFLQVTLMYVDMY